MGLKHLKEIQFILMCADEPMLLSDIMREYENRTNKKLNHSILVESIKYLMKENKVKSEEMKTIYRKVGTSYRWVI